MKHTSVKLSESTFSYKYNDKTIDYSIWANNPKIETVVFLGTVQIGKMPKWVCEYSPPHTAVIQGAPHWFAKNDGSDIPKFMLEFTNNSFESIIKAFKPDKVNIIADSQAVPGVIELFTDIRYQKYVNKIVLLQPLGLNNFAFTGSDDEIITIFKKRILANARYQIKPLINDSKLRHNHRLLGKMVNFNDSASSAQYCSGLKHDAIRSLKKLIAINKNIQIICAENDKIFPPKEVTKNLQENKIKLGVITVNGVPHSPLGTKYGFRLLDTAFDCFEPRKT